jgi:hypothetical protein
VLPLNITSGEVKICWLTGALPTFALEPPKREQPERRRRVNRQRTEGVSPWIVFPRMRMAWNLLKKTIGRVESDILLIAKGITKTNPSMMQI